MEMQMFKNVFDRMGDEESLQWLNARIKFALSRSPMDLFKQVYRVDNNYYGRDLKAFDDPAVCDKKIIIYGAGVYGFHTYHILMNSKFADRVVAFADGDPNKWGKEFCGFGILSLLDLSKKYRDCLVIVSSPKYGKEMYAAIAKNGFPQHNIFLPPFGALYALTGHQYFDMFEPKEHEVFIDAGCYNGNTSVEFVKWCNGKYDKIYAFEPSSYMAGVCRKTFENHDITSYELIEKVCYSEKTEVGFVDNLTNLAGSRVRNNANNMIPADSIDNVLRESGETSPVTFIKMDVEGSELEALKGAKETILKDRPRLAISIYHKREDIFEIPSYILSLIPDYKLYIRHYTSGSAETVLYAV